MFPPCPSVVPAGLSEEYYKKGTWIKEVVVHDNVMIIYPSSSPSANSYQMVRNPMAKNRQPIAEANAEMAASVMLNDMGKSKMRQAKALDSEINAANSEAVAALLAKDLGNKKMAEAKEKEKEQNMAQAEQIANMMGGGLSEKLKREADEAKLQATIQQTAEVGQMFGKMAAKKAFKAALAAGNIQEARNAAASMLQGAWKGKLAKRRVAELKAKKQRLMEESMARKLQSKYRSRLAAKKVQRLKAEKQRLREEGCAIKLQSAWRIRKARSRAAKLKAEKQRLLEEGSALMLQSAWRIRKAKARVSGLKAKKAAEEQEKQRLLQEARHKAAFLLAIFMLRVVSRIKYTKRVLATPQILIFKLQSAQDINIGDVSSSDPYVLVHVESKYGAAGKREASSTWKTAPAIDPKKSITTSLYQSQVISSTLTPVWNEKFHVVNADIANDSLVLSMLDKDTFLKDEFLGQVCL